MSNGSTDTQQKILATAEALIYQNGIHATGMDLLVKTSGVARKSIYRHFENKDDVAAAALKARDVRWLAWFRQECDKADSPEARILGMFTALKSWFQSEGYRGCAFINTAGRSAIRPIRSGKSRGITSRSCSITRWNLPNNWMWSSRRTWPASC